MCISLLWPWIFLTIPTMKYESTNNYIWFLHVPFGFILFSSILHETQSSPNFTFVSNLLLYFFLLLTGSGINSFFIVTWYIWKKSKSIKSLLTYLISFCLPLFQFINWQNVSDIKTFNIHFEFRVLLLTFLIYCSKFKMSWFTGIVIANHLLYLHAISHVTAWFPTPLKLVFF